MPTFVRFVFILLMLSGCTGRGVSPEREQGFYTWVDPQGNLHTIASADKPAPEQAGQHNDSPRNAEADMAASTPPPLVASTPDELWAISDENYLSAEEVQARLDALERDRFVSYPDPDGRVLARPVDMAAEREARQRKSPGYEDIAAQAAEFGQAQASIRSDCCKKIAEIAVPLALNDEHRLVFTGRRSGTVFLMGERPAVAFELSGDVEMVGLQSWVTARGYMHPQILFLNHNSVPVLLVDNLFSRRYPETFFSHRSLGGVVPVPEGVRWVVLFLGYAQKDGGSWHVVEQDAPPGREAGAPLLLEGDVVIRGLGLSSDAGGPER